MIYVSFKCQGRSGNLIFQYLFCKVFTLRYGHKYIPKDEFDERFANDNYLVINDGNLQDLINNNNNENTNILLDGYFQNSELYINYRVKLLDLLYNNNFEDYWILENKKYYITDFLNSTHSVNLRDNDIVINLRLDDFIQLPCKTSDIIPPQYYLLILESMNIDINKQIVYIVCDKFNYQWEREYIKFFDKWKPKLVQSNILNDCALMRDCKILLHSNSTLCWTMSFLSKNKTQRYIPKTNFYVGQRLNHIHPSDIITNVTPLLHDEVYNINYDNIRKHIYPISYSIPDEYVVDTIPDKKNNIASLIPGNISTYKFTKYEEKEYYKMYQDAYFAYTTKKGGWDCLRHYEIISNGCIPIFEDIHHCPNKSLTTFPKNLIEEAKYLFKGKEWKIDESNIEEYKELSELLLEHTKKFCTTSANAKYFFSKMNVFRGNEDMKNILLIQCHDHVNFTRELLWIGIKRYIQNIGGIACEYPKLSILYEDFDINNINYQNNGFTYSRKLQNDYEFNDSEIIEKIKNKFWDLIIFGKVGPEETILGSIPNLPLWNIVKENYNRNKIVFLYGGDSQFNFKNSHLKFHSLFGNCFVRELND
jgi:hypothetical protein